MTSKEALTELFNEANRFPFEKPKYDTYDLLQFYEQIQRDLEALEILKKHMWFSFHKELGFQVFCNDTIDLGNEEEFNLLKERLEDGK